MYYAQQDIELNKKRKNKEYLTTLGLMLPFLAICAAGFAVRNQAMCTAGLMAACAAAIFWGDLRVAPLVRYSPIPQGCDNRADTQNGGYARASGRGRGL